MKINICDILGASWKLGDFGSLEKPKNLGNIKSLQIWEVEKINPSSILYRRRNWVGDIPLKIWGEMPAVGSTSHRKMQGTKCCLEHLMRHHGLQSIRNNYGTREATFPCVEIKEVYEISYPSQNPIFSPRIGGEKSEFWGAIVGIRGLRVYIGLWALFEDA